MAVLLLAGVLGVLMALGASIHGLPGPLGPALALGRPGVAVDPGAPGPYGVGVTVRMLTRTLPDGRQRTVPGYVWYPAARPGGPVPTNLLTVSDAEPVGGRHPLVVFSHGNLSQPSDYRTEIAHLASHGFVVVGPLHYDCSTCRAQNTDGTQNKLRVGDVSASVDALAALSAGDDPILRGMVDPDRVGVAGHSRGGYTALKALEEDRRLRAGLAFAPATWLNPAPDPGKADRPVMVVQGEWDALVPYGVVSAFYDRIGTTPARWFVDLPRTGHGLWGGCYGDGSLVRCIDMLPPGQTEAAVKRWGTAFLLRHVAGDERYDAWLDPALAATPNYRVHAAAPGAPFPHLPEPERPSGQAAVQEATDLICQAGRTLPCDQLRSGRLEVDVGQEGSPGPNFFWTPAGRITLMVAPTTPPHEIASLLAGAATYAALGSSMAPPCADIARAETEQALFWRWRYPDGRYPTDTPRARRMIQIVGALGSDGVVHPDRDPARSCPP